jgi:hypothetical protein
LAVGAFLSRLGGSSLSAHGFNSVGATVTAKILGGPLVPVAVLLQAGAGYSNPSVGTGSTKTNFKTWHVPVGVGITWTIPQPVVALKPWIAPRLDHSRVEVGPVTNTATDFGLSGGVTFGFLNGLSIDLAADRVFAGGTGGKPTTVGIGVSFNVK